MMRGAEAYLEIWERAYGVRAVSCLSRSARAHRGHSFESVLYALGQPAARVGGTYRCCVRGGRTLTVVFDRSGRVV
jgi:hypothetical protein